MKKPIKYLIAVLICCISTALLVFGVYSARQISYSLSGTINYEVNSLYTDVTTSLYALNLPLEQSEEALVNSKMYQLQNSLSESKPLPENVVKISDLNNYSTMGNGVSTENTLTASEKFSINYGDYIQDSQVPTAPVFYLVFEVKNYSSATISALLDLTNLIENTTNTLTNQTMTRTNIYGKTSGQEYSTNYFVVELSFDKHSILKTSNFDNITFTVNAGELVATPQSQFTFSTSGDTATITKYNGTDTDVVIPSHLEDGKTVTTIGDRAFSGNTTIKSVYIPDTIKSLNVYAFNNCTNLTTVEIQGSSLSSISNNAFRYCSSLISINIPNSVTSIGSDAFQSCSSLTSVTIPNSVTSIGSYAFYECNNLKEVHYLGSVNDWLKISFSNSYSNPVGYAKNLYINGELLNEVKEDDFVGLTAINSYAFHGCTSLTNVTIPDSVISIGSYAFYGCSNLREVTLPTNDDFNTINSYTFGYCSSLTTITIPNNVTIIGSQAFYDSGLTSIIIPTSVTSIGGSAFWFCESLTSVTIPNTVTSIGSYAFVNCSNLREVNLPTNPNFTKIEDSTFEGCSSLTSITIPNSVTSIGRGAFDGCSSFTSLTIPESVESIGVNAIRSCENLISIAIPNNVVEIGSCAFYDCINLKEVTLPTNLSFTEIESSTFRNCRSLTNITIPDSVTSIGSDAFYNCESLISITIPNSVTSIGSSAFRDCSNLKEVTLPTNPSFTEIGNSTFSDCTSLTSLTIPESVENLGNSAFDGCTSLTGITIPNSVTSIGSSAFRDCSNLKEVTLPTNPSFMEIGNSTFSNCTSLISLTIPESVESLGNSAFDGCSSLTSVTIPSSVTSIGSSAFRDCSNLKEVILPTNDSFKTINSYTFYGCSSLTSITIPSSVTSIGSSAFLDCSNLKLVFNLSNITITAGSSDNGYVGKYAEYVIDSPNPDNFYDDETWQYYKTDDGTIITLGYTLTIPDGTTSITQSLVTSLLPEGITKSDITKVIIPNSVTNMGGSVFYPCNNLKEVHYLGSVNDWLKISFNNSGSNPLNNGSDLYINGELLTEVKEDDFVGLTAINYYAFYGCESLTSITIPNSVTSIRSSAFSGCSNLREVKLPINDSFKTINGNTFAYCESLTSITIPNSVTSIESYAFDSCSSLKEVNFIGSVNDWLKISFNYYSNPLNEGANLYINGELLTEITKDDFIGLTAIKSYTFYGCESLLSVTIPNTIESIGSYAFYDCSNLKEVTLPTNDSFNTINDYTFTYCSSLTSITIPNSVTSIGSDAFRGCSNLREVTLPINDSFKTINSYTFYYCTSLTNITIPNSVTSIGSYAFSDCYNLKEVTLPTNPSFTTISSYTFTDCYDLTSITIPNSVTNIGGLAFHLCTNLKEVNFIGSVNDWLKISFSDFGSNPLNEGANLYINGNLLTEITKDDFIGLTEVKSYAFDGCESLTSITIPNSVTSIRSSAFSGCSNLREVTLPTNDNFQTINSYTFYDCSSLTTITIPSNVTSIGSDAFSGCNSLYRVIVENETVLKGLTGTSSSVMGGLLSGIDDSLDRIYVLNTMEASIPDYIKSNWVQLKNTETVDGKEYIIFRHA